jgi:hypothetical protein
MLLKEGNLPKRPTVYKRLIARIAATDRLIDEVVYRLYGLTEEAVKVVEGSVTDS